MLKSILPTILFSSSILFAQELRTWKNTDGTNSFTATFISQKDNSVTLRQSNGKLITFDISKLHQDDRNWLNTKLAEGKTDSQKQLPEPNTVFDTLKFGDTRSIVTQKLQDSKIVSSEIKSTFFARTGLNGIFHTKHKIGGLYCYLFFDWDENDQLKEITLQTESKQTSEYNTVLKPCWSELIELIGPIHGKPLQHMEIISAAKLQDGQMMASHLWRMDQGGTVMLGTSRVGDGYQVNVRFTKEKIEPVKVP
jgi:hypothetical protein